MGDFRATGVRIAVAEAFEEETPPYDRTEDEDQGDLCEDYAAGETDEDEGDQVGGGEGESGAGGAGDDRRRAALVMAKIQRRCGWRTIS